MAPCKAQGLLSIASQRKGAVVLALYCWCCFFRVEVLTRHLRRKHGQILKWATIGSELGHCFESFPPLLQAPDDKHTIRCNQNQGRQKKPDLSLANIHFSHLGSPGLWLKETIASNAPVYAVCFPCLKAPACESSLKTWTGKGTGLPFPSTRGLISSCHLSWLSVHTCASECFSTENQSGFQAHWKSQTQFQDCD